MIRLQTPLKKELLQDLQAGDHVILSGTILTARDAAHQRFADCLNQNKELPVNLQNQVLYYTGPSPAPPGKVIGSAGPTTSSRMDKYTPSLLAAAGISGLIGKGNRSQVVIDALILHRCVYFAAVGGAGALLAQHITQAKVLCFPELGPEAVHQLEIEDFPLIVAIDYHGNNLYVQGPAEYVKSRHVAPEEYEV